jgi:hypothetical protein
MVPFSHMVCVAVGCVVMANDGKTVTTKLLAVPVHPFALGVIT